MVNFRVNENMNFVLADNRLATIIALSRQAFGKYKMQIVVLTALGFIGGLLEGIGVNALIPLFSFALGEGRGDKDFISRQIESFFSYFGIAFSVKYLLIFIASLFILKAIVTIILNFIKFKITLDYEEQTRSGLFKQFLSANWPYLIKQKLGYLETVLMTDVPAGAVLLNQLSSALMIATGLSIYVLIAINISVNITLITLVFGGGLFLVFKPLLYKIKVLGYKRAALQKETAHHVNENILGIKTVKTMFACGDVAAKGREHFHRLKDLAIRTALLKSIVTPIIQPVAVIFIVTVFAFSYKSPTFNLAALVAIVYLIEKMFTYVQQLQSTLHTLNDSVPHLRSVLSYEKKSLENAEDNGGTADFAFNDCLEFDNLDFSYDAKKNVLNNINFAIKKGEMVGLIGPSGVGKTTLVDLILRLFYPTNGQILLDGKNVSEINLSVWRKNIGYVCQDIFLMNDTIANNIRFYDNSITDAEIENTARMANIFDFIQSCPEKFNTVVGERGVLLSAGQRQRIVIARILARKPRLLILDEATSALDNESEVQVQKVIRDLKGKVTVFAIAHRLSTIADSDKLIVLENGRVTEQGSPQELLKNKNSYFYKVNNTSVIMGRDNA